MNFVLCLYIYVTDEIINDVVVVIWLLYRPQKSLQNIKQEIKHKPITFFSKDIAISANWFMETISSVPKLSGTSQSEFIIRRVPSTQSSTNMKLRVCSPSPHISKKSVEQMALRQKAAGAFSRPPYYWACFTKICYS